MIAAGLSFAWSSLGPRLVSLWDQRPVTRGFWVLRDSSRVCEPHGRVWTALRPLYKKPRVFAAKNRAKTGRSGALQALRLRSRPQSYPQQPHTCRQHAVVQKGLNSPSTHKLLVRQQPRERKGRRGRRRGGCISTAQRWPTRRHPTNRRRTTPPRML